MSTEQHDDSVLESQPAKSNAAVSHADQVTATNRRSKRGISSDTGADAEHSATETEVHERAAERTAAKQLTVETASKHQAAEVESQQGKLRRPLKGRMLSETKAPDECSPSSNSSAVVCTS